VSAPTNHWKLGAFVLGSVLLGLSATVLLTAQALRVDTITYSSFFDEAVTGLDLGSSVSYRGVKIGTVTSIDVAPDRRHVEVIYSLGVVVLKRLGLSGTTHGSGTRLTIPPDLRVQIASTGLTGTKYLQIDFFDTRGAPPPSLPFPVPENTIPTTPSTMKNLEDAVMRATDQIPELAHELARMATRLDALLDDLDRQGLPGKAAATLADANKVLASLQAKLDQLPVDRLSREASATLATLDRVLDHLDGADGLVASARRTSDLVGDLAAPRLEENLEQTGRDVREAAVALRQLIEAIQRDPDMVLKGKSKVAR
jgi:ABC-type transporter Mla subunit MlaD